jgi:hypothetical protein
VVAVHVDRHAAPRSGQVECDQSRPILLVGPHVGHDEPPLVERRHALRHRGEVVLTAVLAGDGIVAGDVPHYARCERRPIDVCIAGGEGGVGVPDPLDQLRAFHQRTVTARGRRRPGFQQPPVAM